VPVCCADEDSRGSPAHMESILIRPTLAPSIPPLHAYYSVQVLRSLRQYKSGKVYRLFVMGLKLRRPALKAQIKEVLFYHLRTGGDSIIDQSKLDFKVKTRAVTICSFHHRVHEHNGQKLA